jgi:hypothetical protein
MIGNIDSNGRRLAFTIPYHKHRDLQKGLLALIRRFNLPSDIFG